jgi:hypothetical protein
VSSTDTFFLGLIAVGTVVMAAVQVGVILVLVRLARRVEEVSQRVEREIAPLAERLSKVADNLQQATSLAAVQVERVDRLLSNVTRRAEETVGLVQGAVVGPLREGLAVISAIRGVMGAFKSFRRGEAGGRGASRFDDEDPLFIG